LPPAAPVHGRKVFPPLPTIPREDRQAQQESARPEEAPRQIDPLGASALFVGCAALLCASVSWLCVFLVPLSGAALLAGITAVLRVVRLGTSRLTFPVAAVAVASLILGTALFFPGMLGTTYRGYKDQGAEEPAAIRRIALPGSPAATGPEDPDWADASRTALQQGPTTLQVEEVTVGVAQLAPGGNKKGKMEWCLLIRLRIHRMPDPAASAAKQPPDVTSLMETHRPTMTDGAGKVYELFDVQTSGAAEKARGVVEFGWLSRVFVFEAPAAGVQQLRLELPAEVWGGTGTFRFVIPGSMIPRKARG
jgi:hypothetical protein